jgi:cyanophycinase-like exopeptidase
MTLNRARTVRGAIIALAVVALAGAPAASAAGPVERTLVPIGSDYQADTLELFASEAVAADTDSVVRILVLPITYSLDAYTTSKSERKKNETLAAARAGLVEDACNAVKRPTQTCSTDMVPVLVRDDAFAAGNLAYFDAMTVDGMYALGGDQTVAMQVVAGTPVEGRMDAAYQSGAAFGGNSAGDAIQSRSMINGFFPGYGPETSLRQGAVDVWVYDGSDRRGLIFGLPDAIMDQHVFEYGRTGRSISVAVQTGMPVVGMDAATGAVITNEDALSDVTGDTSGYVVDPLTYGASGAWKGPNATLSARRVAVSLVAPGTSGYDLSSLEPTSSGARVSAPSIDGRSYPMFSKPDGSGRLLLAGDVSADPAGPVGQRFISLAGGSTARIVVLTTGYSKQGTARAVAKSLAAGLQPGVGAEVQWFVVDGKTPSSTIERAVSEATGILFTGEDRALVAAGLASQVDVVAAVRARWEAGTVLLADNAVAAALGGVYIADGVSPDVEVSAPIDLLASGVQVTTGHRWYRGLVVEPRLLPDQNWGQLFQLARAAGSGLAVGLDVGTAIEIGGTAPEVVGASAAVVVDPRSATFENGTNGSLVARWLLVDTFADGESVTP